MLTKLVTIAFAVIITTPALAGPYTDALGSCLADNTTGKDRKELARWIFVAMSAHPEMRDLSNTTHDAKEHAFQSVGNLFTRLLSVNCAAQARAAIKSEGSTSFQGAFGSLGQLAMQELMSNPDVNASISGFERYVDKKKLEAALSSK